jgi:hypothetical protein
MSGPTTPSSCTPIIDNNALTASLRALKLGGMLQTLDARLAQARAGELGHPERAGGGGRRTSPRWPGPGLGWGPTRCTCCSITSLGRSVPTTRPGCSAAGCG